MYGAQIKNLLMRGAAILAVQACLLAVVAALRETPPEGPLAFLTGPADARDNLGQVARPPVDDVLGDVLPTMGFTKALLGNQTEASVPATPTR